MPSAPTREVVPAPRRSHDLFDRGMLAAIDRSQATIEFELDGTVVTANDNFLTATGYTLGEVVGQHHRIFCDPEYARTADYADFWTRLGAGEFEGGEYRRVRKDGSPLWLQATCNPIFDADGNPYKIVKFASDITAVKLANAEFIGKVAAIDRAQAVIEFSTDGTIITANENFCEAVGYRLAEMQGKHHRIFCDPAYTQTQEYADFWDRLGRRRV